MDDKRLVALRNNAHRILRDEGIRPEEASRLREVDGTRREGAR